MGLSVMMLVPTIFCCIDTLYRCCIKTELERFDLLAKDPPVFPISTETTPDL